MDSSEAQSSGVGPAQTWFKNEVGTLVNESLPGSLRLFSAEADPAPLSSSRGRKPLGGMQQIKEKIKINTAFKMQLDIYKDMNYRMKPTNGSYLAEKVERELRHLK